MTEWVAFAAESGPAGRAMDLEALRDHALEMLVTIIADLRTGQTAGEQSAKSKGNAGKSPPGVPTQPGGMTAAEIHGAIRAEKGFTLGEMVSEYRALRASVIRLWTRENRTLSGGDLEDLTRFNEAIDQATAESISRFSHDLDYSREMFIAVLGHDLRTPLNAVVMSSQFMLDRGKLEPQDAKLAESSLRSARRMDQMVGDLLDFTRGRLGDGVPVDRAPTDLAVVIGNAVEEAQAATPTGVFRLATSGDLRGTWDGARISQVLANLLSNAAQYGEAGRPVTITVQGEQDEVVLSTHNWGPTIPPARLPMLFDPVKRLKGGAAVPSSGNLGLGLYIAERIVVAHDGTIEVRSSDRAGTTFTVRLPRNQAARTG